MFHDVVRRVRPNSYKKLSKPGIFGIIKVLSLTYYMKVLHINQQRPEARVIAETVTVMERGGVVVLPTDTCYGISADVYNKKAVRNVFDIKQRYYRKPVSILVSSIEMLEPFAMMSDLVYTLVEKYLPGQLTIVVPTITGFEMVHGFPLDTVGFRIPDSPINTAIVESLGKPITTTSANMTGQDNCYSLNDLMDQFKHQKLQPDLILDGGLLEFRKPSTVIQVIGDEIQVLRQGDLVVEEAQTSEG